jgi:hypothetical protein
MKPYRPLSANDAEAVVILIFLSYKILMKKFLIQMLTICIWGDAEFDPDPSKVIFVFFLYSYLSQKWTKLIEKKGWRI